MGRRHSLRADDRRLRWHGRRVLSGCAAVRSPAAHLGILLVASLAEEVAFRGYPSSASSKPQTARRHAACSPHSSPSSTSTIREPPPPAPSSLCLQDGSSPSPIFAPARCGSAGAFISRGTPAWPCSSDCPSSGLTQFSPVISSTALGPTWLTGFDYGPEGSTVAIVVVIALIFATVYTTRDLEHQYAQPASSPEGFP